MTVAQRLEAEAIRRKDTTLTRQALPQERLISASELEDMRAQLRISGAINATARALAGKGSDWVCAI
jgi:hypothetical protein